MLKEAGNKSKNNGSKESKRAAARQSSMKTRSGGKPSGLSYAHLGKGGSERRKPSVKGKGKSANTARPRRPRFVSYFRNVVTKPFQSAKQNVIYSIDGDNSTRKRRDQ